MPKSGLSEESDAKDDSVATRLRQLRGRRPQSTVAAEVGVTVRAYQAWEAGGGISWRNLNALAKFHAVSPEWLLNGGEPAEPARTGPNSVQETLTKILEAMGAESKRREIADAGLLDLVSSARDEWGEIRQALERIGSSEPSSVNSVEAAQLTAARLDSIEEKLQSLLGLALERELETAVEQDETLGLGTVEGHGEIS